MPLNLRLAVLVVTLILAFAIYKILSKRIIPVKYSFLWWLAIIVLLMLVIFPDVFTSTPTLLTLSSTTAVRLSDNF